MDANLVTQKAFNAGYLIEKYLPQLSQLLIKGYQDSENPYVQGFIAGSSEMVKERSKSKFLFKLRDEFGGESGTKSKDRDDREMDIDI